LQGASDEARLRLGCLGLDDRLSRGHRRMSLQTDDRDTRTARARAMMRLSALARIILPCVVLCLVFFVVPAHSQPQGTFIDPDASAAQQQQLQQQQQRIEGRVVIPDRKSRVLIQPAGRVWDYFHEVVLHWLGAIVIAGTLAGLMLAYVILGRIRIAAGRSGRKVPRFTGFERFPPWLT